MRLQKLILAAVLIHLFFLNGCAQTKVKDADKNQKESGQYNHLANAKSPYLQEHADNPVYWHEWNDETLNEAKEQNKPLLISIGYAACHWCHVMERECFMDTTVARIMNDNFICIKVDREERPDIDQIYMNAAQMINGSGGWPLNAFALPDGRPFYAGTYFPKDQWIKLLEQIADLYKNQNSKLVDQAVNITQGIVNQEVIRKPATDSTAFAKSDYDAIFQSWKGMIDYKKGGYNRAPKFPLPVGWEFLLQYHYLTGNENAFEAVNTTLKAMEKGGIYDQVGGGFARYSTDENWFAPHFEKMIYDNGQLISLYANAYKISKDEDYAEVIRQTLTFVKRELTDKNGGFYSSLNADSEGKEGKYYVWAESEIQKNLPPDLAKLIIEYYNVTPDGNWKDGANIIFRKESEKAFAERHNFTKEQWQKKLNEANQKLLATRSKRIRPSTDDKILTGWNAIMLKGYVDAYTALGDKEYLKTALANAQFLEKNMLQSDGSLLRNYRNGSADIPAFLDDYALLADGYIRLYEATFDLHWLTLARNLSDYAIAHFRNSESGMFYYTSDSAESLIARKMEIADNVIPSSNSVMANVLYELSVFYDNPDYRRMSEMMLRHLKSEISDGGPYYANWAILMGELTYGTYEVAVMGKGSLAKSREMQKSYLPMSLFMGGEKENLPLLEDKLFKGKATIFVCRRRVCKMPVTNVDKALSMMAQE